MAINVSRKHGWGCVLSRSGWRSRRAGGGTHSNPRQQCDKSGGISGSAAPTRFQSIMVVVHGVCRDHRSCNHMLCLVRDGSGPAHYGHVGKGMEWKRLGSELYSRSSGPLRVRSNWNNVWCNGRRCAYRNALLQRSATTPCTARTRLASGDARMGTTVLLPSM